MKLYKARIKDIAKAVIDTLCNEGHIDVAPENRAEAQQDLVSILEEFQRRDNALRDQVREHMAAGGIPYENYGKVRNQLAESWNHPTGDEIEKFLSRQFIENFMISRFVDEVYAEDGALWRRTVDIIRSFDVDEDALREEAKGQIKQLKEGTVEYEIAFEKALRDVKKRKGLLN